MSQPLLVSREKIVKAFSKAQRWSHIHLLHFTAAFIITGLPLIHSELFGWIAIIIGYPFSFLFRNSLATLAVGLEVTRWIHRISAFGLASVLVPYGVLELSRIKQWEIWPECWSLSCLKRGIHDLVDYYVYKKKAEFGKYNLGQKLWTWAVIIGIIWMFSTGVILWFKGLFDIDIVLIAHLLHDIGFYLSIIGLTAHVYLAVLIPEHKPMIEAMFDSGELPEEFVKEHHPKWYEKILARSRG